MIGSIIDQYTFSIVTVNDVQNTNPFTDDSSSEAADAGASETGQTPSDFEAEIEALRQTSEVPADSSSANPFAEGPPQEDLAALPDDLDIAEPDISAAPREEPPTPTNPFHEGPVKNIGRLKSPIRPPVPDQPDATKAVDETPEPVAEAAEDDLNNPQAALEAIRAKMETAAAEYSSGKINRAQFSALYKHYSEKRSIIEKLLERDPESDSWKQVAQGGHTTFLRSHFEARPVFWTVFLNDQTKPLMTGGKQLPVMVEQISKLLMTVWNAKERPESGGLARKDIGDALWLALAVGTYGVTFVVFSLQPSALQMNRVRDLHTDFERANRLALERGSVSPERMVFPQRSLLPG